MARAQSSALRDADIRAPLHAWLMKEHEGRSDTSIIHELKIPRPSARVDLAVVNGKLCGFEIKSDVDSFSRLPRQIDSFNRVFDEMYVVTTGRRVAAIKKKVPEWWGIAVPVKSRNKTAFRRVKKSKKNPQASDSAILHMLNRKELIEILELNGLAKGRRSKKKDILVSAIIDEISSKRIRQCARDILRKRRSSVACHQ